MRFYSLHERLIRAPVESVAPLIDTLSSEDDRLWPWEKWPAQRFNRPLSIGAKGGHGPIRYCVEAYDPGISVRYRFTPPTGFGGWHEFDVREHNEGALIRHVLEGETGLKGWLTWQLVLRPLHDALIKDAFDKAETKTDGAPKVRNWSLYVRLMRRLVAKQA